MSLTRALLRTVPLWLCAVAPLFSDVTLRYESSLNTAPFLPPQAREQAEKSMASGAGNFAIRMKNSQGLSSMGRWNSLCDFQKEQITLIDREQQQYSTVKAADFGDQFAAAMPQMPEEAKKVMAMMKTTVDSKMTGRIEAIRGIPAEERELVLTIQLPQPGMAMKMVMQIWTAKPEAALTNPAIRELMGYNLWAYSFMNPTNMMQKMTAQMPGFGDALKSMTDDMAKHKSVMLRNRISMYMPMPPEAAKALASMNPGGAPYDPSAPMFEMTQEAVEVSSAAVDATLFDLPASYKAVPAPDLIKTMMQAQAAAAGANVAKP